MRDESCQSLTNDDTFAGQMKADSQDCLPFFYPEVESARPGNFDAAGYSFRKHLQAVEGY